MSLSVPRALIWIGAVLAGVVLAILIFEGHGGNSYIVYARFHDADDLLPNNFVKIDGIEAGVIKNVYLNKAENTVTVKMGLEKDAGAIGPGASAAIRPVNLLGEKYLDLSPGKTSDPLPSGSVIPVSRTSDPVELDDVFNTLDPHTLAALQIVVNEAGLSLQGRSADLMQTLQELPPTLSAARNVVGQVAAQNVALKTAIDDGNQVLESINSRKGNLQNLISTGQQALASINTARSNLGSTIDNAPAALSQLHTSLISLQGASQALTPAAADLQKATPELAGTLERLPSFTADANQTLQEATSVAPAINRLATQSLPTLEQLRPTVNKLSTFATNMSPLLTALDQQGGLNDVLGFANGWANVTGGGDDLGHVFNLRFSVDSNVIKSVLSEYGSLAGLSSTTKTGAGKSTNGTTTKGGSGSGQNPVSTTVNGVTNTVTKTLNGVTQTLNGVTKTLGGVVNSAGNAAGQVGTTVQNVLGNLGKKSPGKSNGQRTSTNGSTTSQDLGSLLNYLLGK